MNQRGWMLALVVAFCGLLSTVASAADKRPFDQTSFEAARQIGKSILVEVYAHWCPTCWVQQPILSHLLKQPKFKDLVVFVVNFNSQRSALRLLNAQQQSTLIVFKGGKEIGRSVGDVDAAFIEMLLDKAI